MNLSHIIVKKTYVSVLSPPHDKTWNKQLIVVTEPIPLTQYRKNCTLTSRHKACPPQSSSANMYTPPLNSRHKTRIPHSSQNIHISRLIIEHSTLPHQSSSKNMHLSLQNMCSSPVIAIEHMSPRYYIYWSLLITKHTPLTPYKSFTPISSPQNIYPSPLIARTHNMSPLHILYLIILTPSHHKTCTATTHPHKPYCPLNITHLSLLLIAKQVHPSLLLITAH